MIQIIRKIKITKTVPTALSTKTTTATMAAPVGNSETRVTIQKYHPVWK